MAARSFDLGGFRRDKGDALCRRRAALLGAYDASPPERVEAGYSVTCPSCIVRARRLFVRGWEHSSIGIFVQKKKILSIPRKTNRDDLGFPGGKLEKKEGYVDALARECREEADIVPTRSVALFEAPAEVEEEWGVEELYAARESKLTCAFLVHEWTGTPKPMEGLPVEWVDVDRMVESRNSYSGFNKLAFKTAYIPFNRVTEQ